MIGVQLSETHAKIPIPLLQTLVDAGVFDMKSGSVTIHYDHEGSIRKIEKHQVTFKS